MMYALEVSDLASAQDGVDFANDKWDVEQR